MKTPPVKSPETKTTDDALDAPLTNRGFFLGVACLRQAIECEGLLNRDEVECGTPAELVASRCSTYRFLCDEYMRALRAATSLNSAQQEVLKKFNSCLG